MNALQQRWERNDKIDKKKVTIVWVNVLSSEFFFSCGG